MKKAHQGAAIAVVAIGILVCLISAGVLVSELRKERAARERLEEETAQLRQEVEALKKAIPRDGLSRLHLQSTARRPVVEEVRS